jgi:uncharacterized protein (DUF697 family)/predicted GTPase
MASRFSRASLKTLWQTARQLVRSGPPTAISEAELSHLTQTVPAPVLWLFGKTQSGKTSLIRYLTGAEGAVIGNGFRPCTRTSRDFPFPTAAVPILTFLDTRGVDEPSYDPTEDIAAFADRAHLLIVTLRIADFAHGKLRESLRRIRHAQPNRPVILCLTCLHEVDPIHPHPLPYPFDPLKAPIGEPPIITGPVSDNFQRLLQEQAQQFTGLFDRMVPIDLTRPEEGYPQPDYGGEALKRVLLEQLPGAYRETLSRVTELTNVLAAAHLEIATPILITYSSLAATAGGIPIPFVDLLLIPGLQVRMVSELAKLYGQQSSVSRYLELAASLGLGILTRQAARELAKFLPLIGNAAAAALAYTSTYALGRAFCEYFEQIHRGHLPQPETIRRLYHQHLTQAEKLWFQRNSQETAADRASNLQKPS